nr:MAG TPA: hypothetical protein [Bacteriophage sp.]
MTLVLDLKISKSLTLSFITILLVSNNCTVTNLPSFLRY